VRVGGRRVPREVERELWLPGPTGGVAVVGEHGARDDTDRGPACDTADETFDVLGRAG
jgi:hypothetical protein